MESLARLVGIILGAALVSGSIAIFLWRKPPRNIIARTVFAVLMLPVMWIGIFLATLSVGVGVRALGVAIFMSAVLAVKALLIKKK